MKDLPRPREVDHHGVFADDKGRANPFALYGNREGCRRNVGLELRTCDGLPLSVAVATECECDPCEGAGAKQRSTSHADTFL